MNKKRLKALCIVATLSLGLGSGATSHAADEKLQAILGIGEERNQAAAQSQGRVNELAQQTRSLLHEYKGELKQIESLKVHNERLRRRIKDQERRMVETRESITQVTVTQRLMLPLVVRMIDALEQFVELDVPFHIKERRDRVALLRRNLDRSDVSVAEKFRQVLEAYKIENEYGRKIDTTKGVVEIDGVERDVNFLRVGRVALLYQTTDTDLSGVWDQASRSWVELGGGYRNAILKGLRIARKEASIDLLNLPIPAPEVVQ